MDHSVDKSSFNINHEICLKLVRKYYDALTNETTQYFDVLLVNNFVYQISNIHIHSTLTSCVRSV